MIILNLLFPPKCIFCRKLVHSDENLVCPECETTISRTMPGSFISGEHFTQCVAPFYYDGAVREALIRYKFKDKRHYADTFSKYLAKCIEENLKDGYDIVSWVPLSRKRFKERGYDQAKLLAQKTAELLGKDAEQVLTKSLDTPMQSHAGNAVKRRENIKDAYVYSYNGNIAGKRVLLIDDIVTTGSTLSECSKVLMQSGAGSVLCAAVAKAKEK